jgi:hypothetical protein
MEKDWSSRQYYFLNPPEERPLEYEPCWSGTGFMPRRIGLYALSLLYLCRMHSVMVILPRLNWAQVETRLYVGGPLPINYRYYFIYPWMKLCGY